MGREDTRESQLSQEIEELKVKMKNLMDREDEEIQEEVMALAVRLSKCIRDREALYTSRRISNGKKLH